MDVAPTASIINPRITSPITAGRTADVQRNAIRRSAISLSVLELMRRKPRPETDRNASGSSSATSPSAKVTTMMRRLKGTPVGRSVATVSSWASGSTATTRGGSHASPDGRAVVIEHDRQIRNSWASFVKGSTNAIRSQKLGMFLSSKKAAPGDRRRRTAVRMRAGIHSARMTAAIRRTSPRRMLAANQRFAQPSCFDD
jgi:hypothetical protein